MRRAPPSGPRSRRRSRARRASRWRFPWWSAGGRSAAATPTTWSRPTATSGFWPRLHQADHRHHRGGRADPRSRLSATGPTGASRTGPRSSSGPRTCWPATHRQRLNAATMLGQSKTAFQAEIDSACELIDFLRFNVALRRADLPGAARVGAGGVEPDGPPAARGVRLRHHAVQLHRHRRQPADGAGAHGQRRGLEALAHGRAQQLALLSACSGGGAAAGRHQLRAGRRGRGEPGAARRSRRSPGSTSPARPRCSRACGRRSARTWSATAAIPASWGRPAARTSSWPTRAPTWTRWRSAMVRGAYEYQGQKCSAASRAYIPDTLWPAVRDRVVAMIGDIRMGDVADFRNFMGAVIDAARVRPAPRAPRGGPRADPGVKVLAGGGADDSVGWFVAADAAPGRGPRLPLMCEEIFGPVLTAYVYPGGQVERDARAGGPDQAVRAHRRGVRPRSRRAGRGRPRAPERGRQLLRQRQAHRRGRGPAAVRRRARQRDQRQGRARFSTCCAGSRPGASRRRSVPPTDFAIRSWRRPEPHRAPPRSGSSPRRCPAPRPVQSRGGATLPRRPARVRPLRRDPPGARSPTSTPSRIGAGRGRALRALAVSRA